MACFRCRPSTVDARAADSFDSDDACEDKYVFLHISHHLGHPLIPCYQDMRCNDLDVSFHLPMDREIELEVG